ncbi:CLUMA_CG010868, isoform A [Clunio marinus]|uniref:CLUMA_CG010868, isoform A n=1 Tax=Clunio marinus TaxID=568069 RepID=A0A1J1IB15_9DIPT|nr:CLUMA_CG010868, isoform A [Clunio marinus]
MLQCTVRFCCTISFLTLKEVKRLSQGLNACAIYPTFDLMLILAFVHDAFGCLRARTTSRFNPKCLII